METSNPKTGLHPLLTAAAVSITIFSAVGVGALTGVLPHSFGTTKEAAPVAQISAAQELPASGSNSVSKTQSESMPPAAPASTPVRKSAKKVVARAAAPRYEPVTERDFAGAPPPPAAVQPQAQAPVEAPKPVPAGILGVVESVREISTPAKESNGVGPIAGGIAGAVLGNQVGHGMGKNVATVLGAAAGAFGGKEIEKRARATKHWEITVRLDDGSYRTVTSQSEPYWHGGERVRMLDGRLTPA